MSTLVGRSGAFARLAVAAAVAALLLTPTAASLVRAGLPLPCTIDPIADQIVAEGDVVEVVFHAANPNPYPYDHLSLSIGPPAFASLIDNNNGTWTLHIAPGYGDAGTYIGVGVTTSSTNDLHTTSLFDITVTNVNRPPVLDLIPPQTVAEGATKDVQLTASDPDGDPITISKDTLPAFATLTDHHDGTATIHVAPGYSDAGSYSDQTVDVYDGTAYGAQVAFDITVTNTNRPPALDPIADQTVAEGATKDVGLSATDPDGDPLVISGTMPAFATLTDHHDGTATIHLAPGYAASGSYPSVPVTVNDGHGGSDGRTFGITVTNTDTAAPIVTVPDDKTVEATGPAGAAVSYSASATDDVDGAITPSCAPPSGSTFALGHTTVTCTATDSDGHTGSASFDITVTNVNRPPVLDLIPPQTVAEGATKDVQLTASDPDGDPITISKDTLPAFATLTDHHDGTATIHVAPGYSDAGSYSDQTVDVYDGTAYGAQVAFDITVTNTNRPPALDPIADQTVAEGATKDVGLSATDPDGDPLVISGTMPAFATLTDHHDGTATIHLAPGYAASGSYPSVPVTVNDGHGGSDGRTFGITVTNTDTAAPIVTVPDDKTVEATGPAGAAVSYSASATDDVDGAITPSCAPPSGSTFALGHTTVTCTATDSDGHTGSASFVVTVTDTTSPDVTEPGGDPLPDITVAATSAAGARVTFTVGASDTVDATVAPSCRPASGHLFGIGTTRVTCTARDASGNTGSASFLVIVTGSSGSAPGMPETSTIGPSPDPARDGSPLALVIAALGSLLAVAALGRRQRTRR